MEILIVAVIGAALFYYLYSRDLTDSEILKLANIRRTKAINVYYNFDRNEYAADKRFKKLMAQNGAFYTDSIRLRNFPATAAALLKYKKHEWAIIAFEREGIVDKWWVNKGVDRTSVQFGLGSYELVEEVKNGSYNTVLFFHNHPNGDPSHYSCHKPSEVDLESAVQLEPLMLGAGANMLEFVCERGMHHEFWRSVRDSFIPLDNHHQTAEVENGKSRFGNFKLRCELRRGTR